MFMVEERFSHNFCKWRKTVNQRYLITVICSLWKFNKYFEVFNVIDFLMALLKLTTLYVASMSFKMEECFI